MNPRQKIEKALNLLNDNPTASEKNATDYWKALNLLLEVRDNDPQYLTPLERNLISNVVNLLNQRIEKGMGIDEDWGKAA